MYNPNTGIDKFQQYLNNKNLIEEKNRLQGQLNAARIANNSPEPDNYVDYVQCLNNVVARKAELLLWIVKQDAYKSIISKLGVDLNSEEVQKIFISRIEDAYEHANKKANEINATRIPGKIIQKPYTKEVVSYDYFFRGDTNEIEAHKDYLACDWRLMKEGEIKKPVNWDARINTAVSIDFCP